MKPESLGKNDTETPKRLLANLYLHWFDRAVYGENGPAKWAKVELVRYADDFVLLCRKITPKLESFVTEKIEQWLGLKINRDKTRIYEVKASESGLDFLGFNFQLAPSPYGPQRRYWRIAPSKKSEQREVARVREMISNKQQHIPVTELIGDINRHLRRPIMENGTVEPPCGRSTGTWKIG